VKGVLKIFFDNFPKKFGDTSSIWPDIWYLDLTGYPAAELAGDPAGRISGKISIRCTVARSQHGLSANVGQKFGQMRKNSAFFQKYVFTAMHYIIRIKMASLEILSQKKF
jgi:hypothetical protein